MSASLSGVFNLQQFTSEGELAAGHRLYTYAAGTTTQKVAYTDAAAIVPHTYTSDGIGGQYIAIDARGELPAPLFLTSGDYDIAFKTPAGATVWTRRASGIADASAAYAAAAQASAETAASAASAAIVGGANTVVFDPGYPYSAGSIGYELLAAKALRQGRAAPHVNFNWFTSLWTVIGCQGPGRAAVLQDIRDLFFAQFGGVMTGGITYVDSVNGSDSNNGTVAQPWATIDKAIRTSNSGTTYVMPGSYTSAGFRYTDTQGTRPKALIAPFGGVKITASGDVLSAAAWVPDGTFANTYKTVLSTANYPVRVLDSSTVDELGLPTPMPKYGSIATADASGYGWWYDSATKTVYVRMFGLNVNTIKARLSAVYAPGGDNSLLIQSTVLYVENITLDGYFYVLGVVGQATPQAWLKNCTVRYAESNSRNVQGGYCYSQGCTYYRSTADHANYNAANGVIGRGVEINDATWYAGDVDTFGSGSNQPNNPISTSQNKNGSSNHDSFVVRVNGTHNKAYGPPIADTATSYSWCLGTAAGYSYAATGSGQRYGFIMQGNSAWLDGCQGANGLDAAFNADGSANVRSFNCFGTQVSTTSGTFTAYIPS